MRILWNLPDFMQILWNLPDFMQILWHLTDFMPEIWWMSHEICMKSCRFYEIAREWGLGLSPSIGLSWRKTKNKEVGTSFCQCTKINGAQHKWLQMCPPPKVELWRKINYLAIHYLAVYYFSFNLDNVWCIDSGVC